MKRQSSFIKVRPFISGRSIGYKDSSCLIKGSPSLWSVISRFGGGLKIATAYNNSKSSKISSKVKIMRRHNPRTNGAVVYWQWRVKEQQPWRVGGSVYSLTRYAMREGRIEEKKGEGAARLLYVTLQDITQPTNDFCIVSPPPFILLGFWYQTTILYLRKSRIGRSSCVAFELRRITYYRYHMEYRFGAEQQSKFIQKICL